MLSRMVVSSLALLLLVMVVLANGAPHPVVHAFIEQSTLPLTPPPFAPPLRRIGPRIAQPAPILTPTASVSATVGVSATVDVSATGEVSATMGISGTDSVPTPTPTSSLPVSSTAAPITTTGVPPRAVFVVTATPMFLLPTVTPTPAQHALLPTPTPSSLASQTPQATVISAPPATTTPAVAAAVLSPTVTPNRTVTPSVGVMPASIVTTSVPVPPSYFAQGSFASQTVHSDGTIVQQQGSFEIEQVAALNEYAANQHYALRTQAAVGVLDEIHVYQVDDYIAVSYTGGEWMLARRDQGSNIVRAIQPITDLAVLFPRIIQQAEFVGQEELAGATALRYRIDNPNSQGARLIQPLLALTGEIRSLKLEVWIAVPGAYVVAYNFQVEMASARVLNTAGTEVRADQAVTWTYQLTPRTEPEPIVWPAGAPSPTAFPVPGFSTGDFPIPPNTELLTLVAGMPELISTQSTVAVDSFYRAELAASGWTVAGESGYLTCSKEGVTLQLLISEDTATGGTRISVLPSE